MLRLTVLLLVLANVGYFAWSQGMLAGFGLAPTRQSEPHRLQQQLRPQALRVVRGDAAKRGEAPVASRAAECLASDVLDAGQAASLRALLAGWPSGSWTLEPAAESGRWIVYMGKYSTEDQLNRKKAELRQRAVSFENVPNPDLQPGLSLGSFPTEAAATEHLQSLSQRGVRTAVVVQDRSGTRAERLVLPAIDESLRHRVDELRTSLGASMLRPCR